MIVADFDIPKDGRFAQVAHGDHIVDALSWQRCSRENPIGFVHGESEDFAVQMRFDRYATTSDIGHLASNGIARTRIEPHWFTLRNTVE